MTAHTESYIRYDMILYVLTQIDAKYEAVIICTFNVPKYIKNITTCINIYGQYSKTYGTSTAIFTVHWSAKTLKLTSGVINSVHLFTMAPDEGLQIH